MSFIDVAVLAERLHAADAAGRYRMLCEAALDVETSRQAVEAGKLLTAAGWQENAPPAPVETVVAQALARGEVPRAGLTDEATLEWVLACLAPASQGEPAPERATDATRQAMRAATASGRRPPLLRGPSWWGGIGLAIAASIMGLVALTPTGDEWAEPLELSRLRVWRMSPAMLESAKATLDGGATATPLFDVPDKLPRRQRDAIATGVRPPAPVEPCWEAVAETRPTFRYDDAAASGAFEILLLNDRHQLVWSREVSGDGELVYPSDESSLAAGATYFWKVNRHDADRTVASSYVAFRVLDQEQRQELRHDLRSAGGVAFLEGVAYDRHGLYSAAVDAFDRATEEPRIAAAATRARDDVRDRQGPER